jgi:Secretion system C-terminal sorting domain
MINKLTTLYIFRNQTTGFNQLFRFCFAIALIVSFLYTPAAAQFTLHALPKKHVPTTKITARIQSSLALPFWDDFSTYSLDANGIPTANVAFWEKSESVWINNGMGINAPTVYVATFDGLNAKNIPYNPLLVLENGASDSLTSKPIDLSGIAAGDNSVFLSFFYQWRGNGEAPDKNDYLSVQFKDDDNKWKEIQKILPPAEPKRDTFILESMRVEAIYFHENFQFQILRYGRLSGPFDTWNIDYVYLNKNRTDTDNSFPDRAAASQISPLFKPYRSIPIHHFFESKKFDSVTFDVKVLKDQSLMAVAYNATVKIKNHYKESTSANTVELVSSLPINNSALITSFQRITAKIDNLPDAEDPSQFDPLATSIDIRLKMSVISDDENDSKKNDFFPFDLRVNDSISTTSTLSDYYAYDDGAAEYAAGLTQPGNSAAVEFDMLTEQEDTLIALDIYFPDYALANNTAVDLTVYSKIDGTDETILVNIPSKNIERKGTNNFLRVPFAPPVLVKDKFYIGWTQLVGSTPKVGLDKGNDTGDKIFVKTNGVWNQNTAVRGTLMIRPVFGSGEVEIDPVTNVPREEIGITLFPNPNEGSFFIKGAYDQLQVFNVTGQQVNFSKESFDTSSKISLRAASGLYLVHIRQGTSTIVKKIIVR